MQARGWLRTVVRCREQDTAGPSYSDAPHAGQYNMPVLLSP